MSESNNYEETLEEVRGTLSIQEVRPYALEDVLEEYDSFRNSQPQGSIDEFLSLNNYEENLGLFNKENFALKRSSLRYIDHDFKDFADRMVSCYEIVRTEEPDTILYPLRGSEVFKLSMDRVAKVRGEELPHQILLPVGIHGSPYTRDQIIAGPENRNDEPSLTESLRKFSNQEKRAIVQVVLERYASENKFERALLIDEVMRGNSIIENLAFVDNYNSRTDRPAEIKIAAVEFSSRKGRRIARDDESGMLVPLTKNKAYLEQTHNNNRFSFVPLTPPMVVDKAHRLPLVIRENDSTYQMTIYTSEPRISDILEAVEERAK